jgi:hypothetical protein
MSKKRMIDTRFWDDEYIGELSPIEKLLFIYLISNTLTDISGVYEISVKRMVFDTGIERDAVLKTLEKFEKAGNIFYRDGWIFTQNFIKHQTQSPKILTGIKNSLMNCPDWIKEKVSIRYPTLSKPYQNPIEGYQYPSNNLNSNSNLETNSHTHTNLNTNRLPAVSKNLNGNGKETENRVCVKTGSKFSFQERALYRDGQKLKNPNGWMIKSESGCYDHLIEEFFNKQKAKEERAKQNAICKDCQSHDEYPDDLRPCYLHHKDQIPDWFKRYKERQAANGSEPPAVATE